ncbi:hypothetical protein [Streptomyces sp. x-80]|uniref:hypothetical protein n=1 Tax=Streptomyces sp. x-80 TaxID=2789282 RepID=UPI00397F3FDA
MVNYYRSTTVDYERELAQLGERGHRPLRTVTTDDPVAGLSAKDFHASRVVRS